MSLICKIDPEEPWICNKEGAVSQTVNFFIKFNVSVHPKLKIGIKWIKKNLTCDVPTGNMGLRKSSSNCSVQWSEEGVTNAWKYTPIPESVDMARKLISESVAKIQEEIYKQNKGNRDYSISKYSSWITTQCSAILDKGSIYFSCSGPSCSGGSANKNCRQLDKGSIHFNCKTADYFEVTSLLPTNFEPDNAVNDVLKGIADLSTDMEGTRADLHYDPIKPGDKTHLPIKFKGTSPCGDDCARKWQHSGGTSDAGVRVLETPNPRPTGQTITRSGSVKITTHYFYCQ